VLASVHTGHVGHVISIEVDVEGLPVKNCCLQNYENQTHIYLHCEIAHLFMHSSIYNCILFTLCFYKLKI